MNSTMRILLIEDDDILSSVLVQSLTEQRYVVDVAEDGQLGLEYGQEGNYDLILLDVGLPRMDGITLCQRLRSEQCTTPILLMTAKDEADERIRGLDAGADDYLTKPLDLRELQARVRALLRRGEVAPTSILDVDGLRLNPMSCEATYHNQLLKLTPKEYGLLELFLRNPQRVFSRGQIVEHLWTFDDPPLEDSVKAHVKGLRRKLKQAGAVDWIENVYGLGYKLNPKLLGQVGFEDPLLEEQAVEPHPGDRHPEGGEPVNRGEPRAAHSSTPQTFSQAMVALWQQYQGLMAERLMAIQQAADLVQKGALPEDVQQAASKAAHKLAGVLGMFDRDQGTDVARQLEQAFLMMPQPNPETIMPLVRQLEAILNLDQGLVVPSAQCPPEMHLLLVGADATLQAELQAVTQAFGLGWHRVETVATTIAWLATQSPYLVLLDTAEVITAEALDLIRYLADQTPAIPSLVLATGESLGDRVTLAAAGVQGLLTRPITAQQIWDIATQVLQRYRSQSITVLAVDDDPILLGALRPWLEPWGMRVTTLDDPAQFWDVLHVTRPDLLILDVEMPEFTGIHLCQAVRTDPDWNDLPIVFLTSHRDAETVQQVFAAGADDYVTKPILGPELLTRLTNRLERSRLLKTLSSRDPKTGLMNQPQSSREIEQVLLRLAQQSLGEPHPFTFVLLKLLDLGALNAQYGHACGNEILKRWGDLLKVHFRQQAILGYWDHGEFVIGLPTADPIAIEDQLAAVLTVLRTQIFTAPGGQRFQVHYAVGMATASTTHEQVPDLYRRARTMLLL